MKKLVFYCAMLVFLSCSDAGVKPVAVAAEATSEAQNFFPVTNYLRGQVVELKQSGINPLKIVKQGNRVDSIWLKMDELDTALAIFFYPEIDSLRMEPFFNETKFHDKTLNSYTFTYEPKVSLPDSLLLRRWDVYVDPQSGSVRRIFIEKEEPGKKSVQLGWQSASGATVTWFKQDAKGNAIIEKEEIYKWNFEEEE